jgi:hypothetical protein
MIDAFVKFFHILKQGRGKVMTGELIDEILASIGLELLGEDTRPGSTSRETSVSQK